LEFFSIDVFEDELGEGSGGIFKDGIDDLVAFEE
jgi:hypothetical protein